MRSRRPALLALLSLGILVIGCAQQTEQPNDQRQPTVVVQETPQPNTQQAAQDGSVANWYAVTNPHGRGHWSRGGWEDKTSEGETMDYPPAFLEAVASNPGMLEVYLRAKMPPQFAPDYSVHGNTTTQTVTGTQSGSQSNTPSSTPTGNPSTTGTQTGGNQTPSQTPTASTAIDIPVAAGPGSAATGGNPQAGAAGPGGTNTGGATNGNQSANGSVAGGGAAPLPVELEAALLNQLRGDQPLQQGITAALVSGSTADPRVQNFLDWMGKYPSFDARVRDLLATAPPPTDAE